MAATAQKSDGASRLIDTIDETEKKSLEAVRKFVDVVNDAFPDLSNDDGPRRKIIDSAFRMTEQLVNATNQLAQDVVQVTQKALQESDDKAKSSK